MKRRRRSRYRVIPPPVLMTTTFSGPTGKSLPGRLALRINSRRYKRLWLIGMLSVCQPSQSPGKGLVSLLFPGLRKGGGGGCLTVPNHISEGGVSPLEGRAGETACLDKSPFGADNSESFFQANLTQGSHHE